MSAEQGQRPPHQDRGRQQADTDQSHPQQGEQHQVACHVVVDRGVERIDKLQQERRGQDQKPDTDFQVGIKPHWLSVVFRDPAKEVVSQSQAAEENCQYGADRKRGGAENQRGLPHPADLVNQGQEARQDKGRDGDSVCTTEATSQLHAVLGKAVGITGIGARIKGRCFT